MLLVIMKEKTATLSAVVGQRISILSFNFANQTKHNFTSFCSCSRIFFIPPMDLIYSIALNNDTAQTILGVPASNLSELLAKVCQVTSTSSIVPHPRIIGTNFLIRSFFR